MDPAKGETAAAWRARYMARSGANAVTTPADLTASLLVQLRFRRGTLRHVASYGESQTNDLQAGGTTCDFWRRRYCCLLWSAWRKRRTIAVRAVTARWRVPAWSMAGRPARAAGTNARRARSRGRPAASAIPGTGTRGPAFLPIEL